MPPRCRDKRILPSLQRQRNTGTGKFSGTSANFRLGVLFKSPCTEGTISAWKWWLLQGWDLIVGHLEQTNCLSWSFYCFAKIPWPKTKLRRKVFIWLTLSDHSLQLVEVKKGTQAGQQHGGRSWCKDHEKAAYWFTFPGLLRLLSYWIRDRKPRNDIIHHSLGLSPLITH